MPLPHLDKGYLVYQVNSLYLNHCSVPEFKKVFGDFDYASYADEQIVQFALNNDLGEMFIIFDLTNGLLMHINLELYEEIALLDFLSRFRYDKYAYFEYLEDNYIVFNQNLVVRLSQNTDLIATLIFTNSNYVQRMQSEFYESMKKSLENMEIGSVKIPKVISLIIQ